MKAYGVSRYTIRRAVGDLEHEGYIYRVQGGGMYVDDWINKKNNVNQLRPSIGVVTTHIADYIFPSIISGIDRVISNENSMILIGNTHDQFDKERQNLLNMMDHNVAGFIIEPTRSTLDNPNLDVYQMIIDSGKPVVFINAHYPELEFPYVELDDKQDEIMMVNYLLSHGHERILGVFQVDDIQGVNRMNGFVRAYQTHAGSVSSGDIMMYRSDDNIEGVLSQIKSRITNKGDDAPTAIVCYNDALAIEVIGMLHKNHIQVPDDISVAGFDDYELSKFIAPSLTTITHPKRQMGEIAAQKLMKMINKEKVESTICKVNLIVRDSTKAI